MLQGSDAAVSIGVAHSSDGVHWAKAYGRNPGGSVLQRSTTPDDWDSHAVTNPCLVEGLDGQLLMYYHSGRPRPAQWVCMCAFVLDVCSTAARMTSKPSCL